MDSAVIAAFIAAGCAVITSIVNIILNITNSRKSGVLKVIVETRIKFMQSIRDANAIFIGIANPEIVIQYSKNINGKYFYPKEIAAAAGMLKTLLKPFYKIENELIEKINSIEKNCLTLFANWENDNLKEKIKSDLIVYMKLFSIYDWAYWQYIIQQANGIYKNSNDDFEKIYYETLRKYEST